MNNTTFDTEIFGLRECLTSKWYLILIVYFRPVYLLLEEMESPLCIDKPLRPLSCTNTHGPYMYHPPQYGSTPAIKQNNSRHSTIYDILRLRQNNMVIGLLRFSKPGLTFRCNWGTDCMSLMSVCYLGAARTLRTTTGPAINASSSDQPQWLNKMLRYTCVTLVNSHDNCPPHSNLIFSVWPNGRHFQVLVISSYWASRLPASSHTSDYQHSIPSSFHPKVRPRSINPSTQPHISISIQGAFPHYSTQTPWCNNQESISIGIERPFSWSQWCPAFNPDGYFTCPEHSSITGTSRYYMTACGFTIVILITVPPTSSND